MLHEDEIDTSWWHRPLKREDSPCEIGSLWERTIPSHESTTWKQSKIFRRHWPCYSEAGAFISFSPFPSFLSSRSKISRSSFERTLAASSIVVACF